MIATDTFLGGFLIVAISVLLALAGLVVAHRLVPTPLRESHTNVAGLMYMPLSGLVGVVIAFTIVFAWQNFNAAYKTTQDEAAALADVYWLQMTFPTWTGKRYSNSLSPTLKS